MVHVMFSTGSFVRVPEIHHAKVGSTQRSNIDIRQSQVGTPEDNPNPGSANLLTVPLHSAMLGIDNRSLSPAWSIHRENSH